MGRGVKVNREDGTIEATRRLRASGNSVVLTIPQELLDATAFEEGDDVHLVAEMIGDKIELRQPDGEGVDIANDDSSE